MKKNILLIIITIFCLYYFSLDIINDYEVSIKFDYNNIIALTGDEQIIESKLITQELMPVGTIYKTTTEDTIKKVEEKFGGTWERYAEGKTVLGKSEILTEEGGNNSVKLSLENIPSITISGTTDSTGSGYTVSTTCPSVSTNTTGNHSHYFNGGTQIVGYNPNFTGYGSQQGSGNHGGSCWVSSTTTSNGGHTHTVNDYYLNGSTLSGVEAHTHSYTASNINNNQENVDIQNPYTVVYMYKRTA